MKSRVFMIVALTMFFPLLLLKLGKLILHRLIKLIERMLDNIEMWSHNR